MKLRRLSRGAPAALALGVGTVVLYATQSENPAVLNFIRSSGWASLKPRVSEEKNLIPVFDDIGKIPYPGDQEQFFSFMNKRIHVAEVRKKAGLDGSGNRMSEAEKRELRNNEARDEQLTEFILMKMNEDPKRFEGLSINDVKYRPFRPADWETHPRAQQLLANWEARFR
ncbi:putative mitochondrial protein [Andalucia godoyi]|uniref:Putative mitochondrial protein n=1 Tax=Andalucia godoyi TaxID=505711 RepID=A0A8K0F4I9_ANDGO|nr:putative mitochondrial protein [Andalucia godoyi]|eukprot:ANDGO_08531.mRNA.1 putative mitochondrial protein